MAMNVITISKEEYDEKSRKSMFVDMLLEQYEPYYVNDRMNALLDAMAKLFSDKETPISDFPDPKPIEDTTTPLLRFEEEGVGNP